MMNIPRIEEISGYPTKLRKFVDSLLIRLPETLGNIRRTPARHHFVSSPGIKAFENLSSAPRIRDLERSLLRIECLYVRWCAERQTKLNVIRGEPVGLGWSQGSSIAWKIRDTSV